VFLVVYCGERYPVTREDADRWRQVAEREVEKYVPLRENRRGRTVSRPFPYPALHPEIKYHRTGERRERSFLLVLVCDVGCTKCLHAVLIHTKSVYYMHLAGENTIGIELFRISWKLCNAHALKNYT